MSKELVLLFRILQKMLRVGHEKVIKNKVEQAKKLLVNY